MFQIEIGFNQRWINIKVPAKWLSSQNLDICSSEGISGSRGKSLWNIMWSSLVLLIQKDHLFEERFAFLKIPWINFELVYLSSYLSPTKTINTEVGEFLIGGPFH